MNRRLSYRHEFEEAGRLLRVRLDSAWQPLRLVGKVRDLSLGGMNVSILEPAVSLDPFRLCLAELRITEDCRPGRLTAEIVYINDGPDGRRCGMRFLPLIEPLLNEKRDKTLWRFLLEQQRSALTRGQETQDSLAFYPRLFIPDRG